MKIFDKEKKELEEKVLEDENLDVTNVVIAKIDLVERYYSNLKELAKLIKPLTNQERVKKLIIENVNLYNIGKINGIDVVGSHYLVEIAEKIGYNVDKVRSKLSVGAYYRVHRPEDQDRPHKSR